MLIFTKEKPSMATSICKKANRPAQVILVGLGTPIWGMSPTERLRRMFARLNVSDLSQWDGKSPKTEFCYVISADYAFSQILFNLVLSRLLLSTIKLIFSGERPSNPFNLSIIIFLIPI